MTPFVQWILVIYVAWALIGLPIARLRFDAWWNKHTRRSDDAGIRISCIYWLHRLVPVLVLGWVVWLSEGANPVFQGRRAIPILDRLVLVMVPFAWDACITWITITRQRAAAADSNKINRRTSLRINLVWPIGSLMLSGWIFLFNDVPGLVFMFVALSIGPNLLTQQGAFSRTLPGSLIEFKDTPLFDEIGRVAAAFGAPLTEVQVMVPRKQVSTYRTPLLLLITVRQASIPLPNYLCIDPASLTAAVALYVANGFRPGSLAAYLRLFRPFAQIGGVLLLIGLLVGIVTSVGWTATLLSNYAVSIRMAGTALVLAAELLAVVLALRLAGMVPTPKEAMLAAFRTWRAAEKNDTRTVSDFVCALAEYHAFREAIHDPEVVILQIRRRVALQHLLKGYPPETATEAFANAVQFLQEREEMMSRRVAGEGGELSAVASKATSDGSDRSDG